VIAIKINKGLNFLEKVAKVFEIGIAVMLLVIVAIKVVEVVFALAGYKLVIIAMEFESILSVLLGLVIGVEFCRMLIKHTPESVIDVLLFAIARYMVVYHERIFDLLIGVTAIAALIAVKKYFLGINFFKGWDNNSE
jgi:hypothetical protein